MLCLSLNKLLCVLWLWPRPKCCIELTHSKMEQTDSWKCMKCTIHYNTIHSVLCSCIHTNRWNSITKAWERKPCLLSQLHRCGQIGITAWLSCSDVVTWHDKHLIWTTLRLQHLPMCPGPAWLIQSCMVLNNIRIKMLDLTQILSWKNMK